MLLLLPALLIASASTAGSPSHAPSSAQSGIRTVRAPEFVIALQSETTTYKYKAKGDKVIVKVKSSARVFYEPASNARIVEELTLGAPVTVVEERGDWIRVKSDSGEGWVQRTYVDMPGPGGVVLTRTVTVRTPTTMLFEPATTSRVVRSLPVGAPITFVEERGDWIRVKTDSGEGWVQRTYVDLR